MARFAMTNRGALMQAAAGVRRRWKRGKLKKKSLSRRSYATPRDSLFDTGFVPGVRGYNVLRAKELYYDRLDLPNINNRLTQQIYVKGLKLCLQLHNTADFPVEIHVAMIQFSNILATDTLADIQKGFFRADQGGVTDLDFINYTPAPQYDLRYMCNPLNPDNKKIIFHKKYKLGRRLNQPGGFAAAQSGYEVTLDRYIPLKRVAKFQNNASGDALNEKPWVLCMWAMASDMDDHDATSQQDLVKWNYKKKFYFKNMV